MDYNALVAGGTVVLLIITLLLWASNNNEKNKEKLQKHVENGNIIPESLDDNFIL